MERPYVFCHILTNIEGQVNSSLKGEHNAQAVRFYDQLPFVRRGPYHIQGWMAPNSTTDEKFTHHQRPQLQTIVNVPKGDYIIHPERAMYYISLDPRGQIGWESNYIVYHHVAYVIEVLSEQASESYKDFLRRKHIPYIICGQQMIDYGMMLEKLKRDFGIKSIMLAGGPIINYAFMEAGLCDELSIVIAPSMDAPICQSTFLNPSKQSHHRINFDLIEAKTCEGNTVWLRYKVHI